MRSADGEILEGHEPSGSHALDPAEAHLITSVLRGVVDRGTGFGVRTRGFSGPVAGKTGTTDDYRDSWFAGFSADRVAVVWVGRDDNQPTGLSGSSGALPVWARVMRDLRVRNFDPIPPASVETLRVDRLTGQRADDGCAETIEVPFMVGWGPQEWAPCAYGGERSPLRWLRDIFER